jgi:hypothetical protein
VKGDARTEQLSRSELCAVDRAFEYIFLPGQRCLGARNPLP